MQLNENNYGIGDSSYQAAGELAGIIQLVDTFYKFMDRLPEAKKIRNMHPEDLVVSQQKLVYFLCSWLGGPRLYKEHYGSISIPGVHRHLDIGAEERDAWLHCMEQAIVQQPYTEPFKKYLKDKLSVPAERVRAICQRPR